MLRAWFWSDTAKSAGAVEVWQKTCCYLYLPRLKDSDTLRQAITAGASSRDFFGIAYGNDEGRYQGFHFGEKAGVILDNSLLLIEPKTAAGFASQLAAEEAEREAAAERKPVESGKGQDDKGEDERSGGDDETSGEEGDPKPDDTSPNPPKLFLADKVSRGWKPNNFISSKLSPL